MSRTPYRLRSPEHKRAARARWLAGSHERRGTLKPLPCESCGSEEVEKHHEDYSQPLRVRWLCRRCHIRAHSFEGVASFARLIGRAPLEVAEVFARTEDARRTRRLKRVSAAS